MKIKKTSKNNTFKNIDQFLTVNNEQVNNNIENMKKKKNKTFDFNIMNNLNNNLNNNNNDQKTIVSSNMHSPSISGVANNNRINPKINDFTKNKQKHNSFGGSKFNLVKGSIVNIIKKPNTNAQNNNNL